MIQSWKVIHTILKSEKLLDEAGYKDVDGDGIREGGKEFKITFVLVNVLKLTKRLYNSTLLGGKKLA